MDRSHTPPCMAERDATPQTPRYRSSRREVRIHLTLRSRVDVRSFSLNFFNQWYLTLTHASRCDMPDPYFAIVPHSRFTLTLPLSSSLRPASLAREIMLPHKHNVTHMRFWTLVSNKFGVRTVHVLRTVISCPMSQ